MSVSVSSLRIVNPTTPNALKPHPSSTLNGVKDASLAGYYKSVAVSCLWVVLPMAAFTGVILWMILGHRISPTSCPYPELCLKAAELNNSISDGDYIVDFPAARLVFIASWSSTVSFALTGVLMSLHGFSLAGGWLHTSIAGKSASCPTPYQTSLILRFLNAELLVLWQILWGATKSVFWKAEKSEKADTERGSRSPKVLRAATIAFVIAVFGSALVQISDTYLHISTEAIELTELNVEDETAHSYSRLLAPSCWNQTRDKDQNPYFWSCTTMVEEARDGAQVIFDAREDGLSKAIRMGIANLTARTYSIPGSDSEKDIITLLVPRSPPLNVDWKATSFGISTKCHAIRNDSCMISEPQYNFTLLNPIGVQRELSCQNASLGFTTAGVLMATIPQYQFLDFHRYIDPIPLRKSAYLPKEAVRALLERSRELSDEESKHSFRNPWRWLWVTPYNPEESVTTNDDTRGWYIFEGLMPFLFLSCNTTVWDVSYTMVNQKLASITRSPSNSTTTGALSMVVTDTFGYNGVTIMDADEESLFLGKNKDLDTRIDIQGAAGSRALLSEIVAQTISSPALSVQSRTTRIVTSVPKLAVWLLVAANLIFMLLAIVYAGIAVYVASPQVQQLALRLNITGLTALGFEGDFALNEVKESKDLFEEHGSVTERKVKRVHVEETAQGGAAYVLLENPLDSPGHTSYSSGHGGLV